MAPSPSYDIAMTLKLTGTDRQDDGQDHVLSQADALTKNCHIFAYKPFITITRSLYFFFKFKHWRTENGISFDVFAIQIEIWPPFWKITKNDNF